MDYKKKYNEMVRRAKELHESGNALTRQQMEIVCPELTESEDEKIKKAILGLTYLDGIEPILTKCSITRREIRAYLEKQKEQKPAEWSDTNELVFKDICKHLKEEGYNGWIVLLEALHSGEFKQPVTEWGEEDERKYQCIRNILLADIDKKVGSWKYSEILEWYEKRGIGRYTNSKPSWKPSKEQMEALERTIHLSNFGAEQNRRKSLSSLLKQLKKQ